jgi:hypothetical protein
MTEILDDVFHSRLKTHISEVVSALAFRKNVERSKRVSVQRINTGCLQWIHLSTFRLCLYHPKIERDPASERQLCFPPGMVDIAQNFCRDYITFTCAIHYSTQTLHEASQ